MIDDHAEQRTEYRHLKIMMQDGPYKDLKGEVARKYLKQE